MKKELSEAQKYQKKKNRLIVLFLVLLVVFVGIMCAILIYAKNNPPRKFISPDDIEIKEMQVFDYEYVSPTNPDYIEVTESTNFIVTEEEQELELTLTEDKEIKLVREDQEEAIEIMQNDKNVNNNIKLIYQKGETSLILTETGELYKLIDTNLTDGQLKVGQVLSNMKVKNIIRFTNSVAGTYIINEENKLINLDNQKEYKGVIQEVNTGTSTIYIYEKYYFGLEEGKVFVDENNQFIKINIAFENKIVDEYNRIYEIDAVNNTISTSNFGEFDEIGFQKEENEEIYKMTIITNTGVYDLNSSYYYKR